MIRYRIVMIGDKYETQVKGDWEFVHPWRWGTLWVRDDDSRPWRRYGTAEEAIAAIERRKDILAAKARKCRDEANPIEIWVGQ